MSPEPHHRNLTSIKIHAHAVLSKKAATGKPVQLSKKEAAAIKAQINEQELRTTYKGVNFSRVHIDTIFRLNAAGVRIEFETVGPYLADYAAYNGILSQDNLVPEDAIGVSLARYFRSVFPEGRLISLCDDYNSGKVTQTAEKTSASFPEALKRNFKDSFVALLKEQGAILPGHKEGADFLLISEAAKVVDAERLVAILEARGYIRRDDQMVTFVNDDAENPLHRRVRLRTKSGRWLCEALDAATFLKPENLAVVHIVVLPDYMRDQQDRVWEILRILGIQPARYHNIFFDPTCPVQDIVQAVSSAFEKQRPAAAT